MDPPAYTSLFGYSKNPPLKVSSATATCSKGNSQHRSTSFVMYHLGAAPRDGASTPHKLFSRPGRNEDVAVVVIVLFVDIVRIEMWVFLVVHALSGRFLMPSKPCPEQSQRRRCSWLTLKE